MTQTQPSRPRRLGVFLAFRLLPVLLILGIFWFGYGTVRVIARYITEQNEADQRRAAYSQTATAVAPTLITHTPASDSATPVTPESKSQAGSLVLVAQILVTNTPNPALVLPPTNTLPPTPTLMPTAEPPTAAPTIAATVPLAPVATRPLPTLIPISTVDPNDAAAAPTAIPTPVPTIARNGNDLFNILLLGTDGEITGDNFDRTDTMIILSINRTTNTVAMLSLPRDLFVYIPGWTMQRLNLAYTHGEIAGWTDGGFGLIRETILYNLGINVHYYALVSLSGFKQIIDTLGGVDLAVDCAIQDLPLIEAPPPAAAGVPNTDGLYTLPVGYYTLDGGGALWYARSRHNSSDFDRGRRQQQVLRAIWRKARDTGQLAKFPELWNQATQVVKTNVAFEDMLGLLPLALSLDTNRMEQFTFTRTYHTTPWQPPDGSYVQLPNYEPIKELLDDFYQPPTTNQVIVEGAQIQVFNGTGNANWDRVAAERLGGDGFNAVAAGAADNASYIDTILIDYTGRSKGSSIGEIAAVLNVRPENIRVEPDPNRTADFAIIIGSNYNSCSSGGVLPVEEATTGG